MAYRFQQGDPVFHQSTPEAPNVTGLYTIQKVGTDGMIYRLIDRNGDFTDAGETEIEHVSYALFTRVPEGWPIIVPKYDKILYTRFLNSDKYNYLLEGSATVVLKEQTKIMAQFDDEQSNATS